MTVMETVFDWVVASSLQASLPVVVVLVIQFTLRKHLTAHWRYALWLPILLALLLPKTEVFLGSYGSLLQPDISQWGAAILASPDPLQTMTVSMPDISGSQAEGVEAPRAPFYHGLSFPVIWLVGTGLFSALALSSFALMFRRVARSARPAEAETILQIERVASEIGLHRLPTVLVSPAVKSPAVCGLWRGLLMLNDSFEQDLSRHEQEMVLRHELTHLRRKDLMWNALFFLLLAVHWFNPLLWLAFFRACADREAACDAEVLRGCSKRRRLDYGHTLLKLETGTSSPRLNLGFIGIQANAIALRRRLRLIISEPTVPAFLKPLLPITMVALVSWGSIKPTLKANELSPGSDAFGKVSEAYIKSLFEAEEHDEKLVKDQLSRADYNSKQKHRFELHQSRKGLGMVYFRTNEGNYGKLLYTWGIGPKLHLMEIVVFDSQSGKTVVRTDKNIVLDLAGHYDLDTGVGTHASGRDDYGDDNYRPDLHHGSMHGPDRHLKGIDGASFLFPIGHGALDAG
jgi:beta-lactamase regulating signal transducer with metallopeptidase domain